MYRARARVLSSGKGPGKGQPLFPTCKSWTASSSACKAGEKHIISLCFDTVRAARTVAAALALLEPCKATLKFLCVVCHYFFVHARRRLRGLLPFCPQMADISVHNDCSMPCRGSFSRFCVLSGRRYFKFRAPFQRQSAHSLTCKSCITPHLTSLYQSKYVVYQNATKRWVLVPRPICARHDVKATWSLLESSQMLSSRASYFISFQNGSFQRTQGRSCLFLFSWKFKL